MNDDFITLAKQERLIWDRQYAGVNGPSFTVVTLQWTFTMVEMVRKAKLDYHRPLRFEVNHMFEDLVKDVPEKMVGLPVSVSDGSLIRLICERATYEVAL